MRAEEKRVDLIAVGVVFATLAMAMLGAAEHWEEGADDAAQGALEAGMLGLLLSGVYASALYLVFPSRREDRRGWVYGAWPLMMAVAVAIVWSQTPTEPYRLAAALLQGSLLGSVALRMTWFIVRIVLRKK